MIAVTIGNNLTRTRFNINPDTTIRQALEEAADTTGVDYVGSMLTLDGTVVSGSGFDKTFAEWGYTGEPGHDRCYLISVVKSENA